MNFRCFLSCLLSAVILCGCSNETKNAEVTETTTITTADTQNEYALVRDWTGKQLLESIFYCGEYRPLPMSPDEYSQFALLEGIIYFDDNSYANAETDENGNIVSLQFSRGTSPSDFSLYGIDFSARPSDIPKKVGYANSVMGIEDEHIVYTFEGGGITQLVFEFTNRQLTTVYIKL
ncbi:MAG: hypothetical protein J6K17_08910 [Oscillospiraceae bacterium]|nr:hypothetical protein [Oscillospiraceae bacterium]